MSFDPYTVIFKTFQLNSIPKSSYLFWKTFTGAHDTFKVKPWLAMIHMNGLDVGAVLPNSLYKSTEVLSIL